MTTILGWENESIPQGLKPVRSGGTWRAKAEALAYLEARAWAERRAPEGFSRRTHREKPRRMGVCRFSVAEFDLQLLAQCEIEDAVGVIAVCAHRNAGREQKKKPAGHSDRDRSSDGDRGEKDGAGYCSGTRADDAEEGGQYPAMHAGGNEGGDVLRAIDNGRVAAVA